MLKWMRKQKNSSKTKKVRIVLSKALPELLVCYFVRSSVKGENFKVAVSVQQNQPSDLARMGSSRVAQWRHTHKQTVTLTHRQLLLLLPALNPV